MTDLIESLYRLYEEGLINESKIKDLLRKGEITTEECRFILRKEK